MAAGLQLKNQLTSKDETVKLKFQSKWLQLPEEMRNYVKKNVSGMFYRAMNFSLNILFIDIEYTWN